MPLSLVSCYVKPREREEVGPGFAVGVVAFRGLPYMTSAKFSDFFYLTITKCSLVTFTNQLILFLLSAFWGPPSPPPTADVIYVSPLTK